VCSKHITAKNEVVISRTRFLSLGEKNCCVRIKGSISSATSNKNDEKLMLEIPQKQVERSGRLPDKTNEPKRIYNKQKNV